MEIQAVIRLTIIQVQIPLVTMKKVTLSVRHKMEKSPEDNSPPKESLNNDTDGDNPSRKDYSQTANEPRVDDNLILINDTAIGSVDGSVNLPRYLPIAHIGPDKEVSEGTTLIIDGSKSSDPNGDELHTTWQTTKDAKVSPVGPS